MCFFSSSSYVTILLKCRRRKNFLIYSETSAWQRENDNNEQRHIQVTCEQFEITPKKKQQHGRQRIQPKPCHHQKIWNPVLHIVVYISPRFIFIVSLFFFIRLQNFSHETLNRADIICIKRDEYVTKLLYFWTKKRKRPYRARITLNAFNWTPKKVFSLIVLCSYRLDSLFSMCAHRNNWDYQ